MKCHIMQPFHLGLHGLPNYSFGSHQYTKVKTPIHVPVYVDTHRSRKVNMFSIKLKLFSYQLILTYVLGAQKDRLIETVLLSTHNICFG